MGTYRDYLHLGKENLFDVVAIGLNDEGKWAIFIASGACTFTNDPLHYSVHTGQSRMQNVSGKGYSKNFARVVCQITGVLLCDWKSGH